METKNVETKNTENKKQIIFSGIQPTGTPTLGNYIGALRNWVNLQDRYQSYYCVVDLHSITVRQEAADLRKRTVSMMALLLACGIDPEKSVLFMQSHVSAHAELAWVLNCNSYMGELGRMTQFKDKSVRHGENINAGLFTYPVLMASDILLYQADLVPVGEDQKQHLELARNLAIRFNNAYSDTFAVPDGYIPKVGARIMSLTEPTAKMSKSDENENSFVTVLDPPEVIVRKLKRAVTDSEGTVRCAPDKPGVSNLMSIYSVLTGLDMPAIEDRFSGKGYGDFKQEVADAIIEELLPIQTRLNDYLKNKDYLNTVLASGRDKAAAVANKTLAKVYKKVGFAPYKL